MAQKQTYIIYINRGDKDSDFFRVGCKRVKTALNYLRNWYNEGKKWGNLYNCFYRDGARFEVVATPNGYDGSEVVASGLIVDLFK